MHSVPVDNYRLEEKIKDLALMAGHPRESIGIKSVYTLNPSIISSLPLIVGFGKKKDIIFSRAAILEAEDNDVLLALAAHQIGYWSKGYAVAKLLIEMLYILQFTLILRRMIPKRSTKSDFVFSYVNAHCFYTVYRPLCNFITEAIFQTFIKNADRFVVQAGYGQALLIAIGKTLQTKTKGIIFSLEDQKEFGLERYMNRVTYIKSMLQGQ
ncbi:zinc metalloprotease [Glugoides intestinalis]